MNHKRLAHYQIIEKIGEGGMGEVFRARDTRLDRDVALKFLPESLATDPDRLGRFEREAKLLAALNHPHIASIHGFESVENQRFLVLELVEGEDLAVRLARGPVPLDEALSLCRQIADALEAAHEEGIIHRDLKPGNVAVTADGTAKVLDFGLARAWEPNPSSAELSHSPTVLTHSPTVAGVILGTAAYMSPEQARGQRVDRRADIFSFGCVLFELLTGVQTFAGEMVSDTLAAVLRAEPNWSLLPTDTPQTIRKLLERCLEKNPRERLRDIGEARIAIDAVLRGEDSPAAGLVGVLPQKRKTSERVAWAIAAICALAAAAIAVWPFPHRAMEDSVVRTSILPPSSVRFNLHEVHPGPAAISPDGLHIVFSGRQSGGNSTLFVRDLDNPEARALPGTDGAGYPFWSADGRSIGFFAEGKMRRVDVTGGPPTTICSAELGKGGSWNRDGTIIFAPAFNTPIYRVSDSGGTARAITTLNKTRGENSHRFPVFLPDGNHFLYLDRAGNDASTIRAASLSGDTDRKIMRLGSSVAYASGYLLFLRQFTLMARPFDLQHLAFTGDAIPVVNPVRYIPGAMWGIFSASDNGMLIYQGGSSVEGSRMVWRRFDGKLLDSDNKLPPETNARMSPDGRHVCVSLYTVGGTSDLWIYDVARRIRTRFTFDPSNDDTGVWSPDGRRIAFASNRMGPAAVFIKRVGGATSEKLLYKADVPLYPSDWSPDGRYLICNALDSSTVDIWAIPLAGQQEPAALLHTKYLERDGHVAPNGHWISYTSNESGRMEIYVTSFPRPGRKWQISGGGGEGARWMPDGSGIVYGANNSFYRVETRAGDQSFAVGETRRLFESNTTNSYAIHPDGKRLLLLENVDKGGGNPLTLVTHWTQMLRKRR